MSSQESRALTQHFAPILIGIRPHKQRFSIFARRGGRLSTWRQPFEILQKLLNESAFARIANHTFQERRVSPVMLATGCRAQTFVEAPLQSVPLGHAECLSESEGRPKSPAVFALTSL